MARSLDEIISGFNQMAGTLGLTPGADRLAPYGVGITPAGPPPPPRIRTPAEASSAVAQGAYLPTVVYGAMPPPPPPPTATLPQFNYASVTASQMPLQAAMMGGFAASPGYMTQPQFGVFRPGMTPASPMGFGGTPTPFTPMPPMASSTLFTPPGDFAAMLSRQSARQSLAENMMLGMGMGQVGIGAAAGFGLGSVGAAVGGMFGGRFGAGVGALAGGIGGMAFGASDMGRLMAGSVMSPMMHERAFALRVQEATQNLIGGSGAGVSGRGLSASDASQVARELTNFADRSKGLFNQRDMSNILQVSADQGLLDFARNGDQIAKTVKSISSVLASVAKITGDPDLRRNLGLIGQMQRFGYSPLESMSVLNHARGFARLAGADVGHLMATEGMAGATTFQGAGLLAGSGAMSAMYGAGMARSMMQSGAVDPTMAALLGGQSGMTQRMVGAEAAFLQGQGKYVLQSVLKMGAGGLQLDQDAIKRLQGGQVDLNQVIQQAAQRMGSMGAIGDYSVHGNELLANFNKQMGPEGTQQLMMRLIKATQDQLGGARNGVSFELAAMNMGMDQDTANMYGRMLSKGNLQNIAAAKQRIGYSDALERAQAAEAAPGYFGAAAGRMFDRLNPHFFASGSYGAMNDAESATEKEADAMGRRYVGRAGTRMSSDAQSAYLGMGGLDPSIRGSSPDIESRYSRWANRSGFGELNRVLRASKGGVWGTIGNQSALSLGLTAAGTLMGGVGGFAVGGVLAGGADYLDVGPTVGGVADYFSRGSAAGYMADQKFQMGQLAEGASIFRGAGQLNRLDNSKLRRQLSSSLGGEESFSNLEAAIAQHIQTVGQSSTAPNAQELKSGMRRAALAAATPSQARLLNNPQVMDQVLMAGINFSSEVSPEETARVQRTAFGSDESARAAARGESLENDVLDSTKTVRQAIASYYGGGVSNVRFSRNKQAGELVMAKIAEAEQLVPGHGKEVVRAMLLLLHPDKQKANKVLANIRQKGEVGAKVFDVAVSMRDKITGDDRNVLKDLASRVNTSGSTEELKAGLENMDKMIRDVASIGQRTAFSGQAAAIAEKYNLVLGAGNVEEQAFDIAKGLQESDAPDALKKAAANVIATRGDKAANLNAIHQMYSTSKDLGILFDSTVASSKIAAPGGGLSSVADQEAFKSQVKFIADMKSVADSQARTAASMESAAEQLKRYGDRLSDAQVQAGLKMVADAAAELAKKR